MPNATVRANARALPETAPPLSPADQRAVDLWSLWRERKDAWHRLADSPQGDPRSARCRIR
jgi:hypothetical protein